VNQQREWLVDQVMAGTVKAAAIPEQRAADDDFCSLQPTQDYCRRIAGLAITEMHLRGREDAMNFEMREAQEYLDRVIELEIKRARNGRDLV
jgi:hypothetical protein